MRPFFTLALTALATLTDAAALPQAQKKSGPVTDYDAIIVGGGPSGLSAASGLARVRRNVLLIDSGEYRNGPTRHMHDVLGFDGVVPAYFRWAARQQISHYKTVTMVNGTVLQIRPGDEQYTYFVVSSREPTAGGGEEVKEHTARKIVLATGMRDVLPETPGLRENWGKGIYWCPWCDGYEHADQRLGLLGSLDSVPSSVREILTLNKNVIALVNGTDTPEARAATDEKFPHWEEYLKVHDVRLDNRTISAIVRVRNGTDGTEDPSLPTVPEHDLFRVDFTDGKPEYCNAFLTSFPSEQASSVGEDLGVQLVNGRLYADPSAGLLTNIPGVYAVGDANSDNVTNVPHALYSGKRSAVYLHVAIAKEDAAREVNKRGVSTRDLELVARSLWDTVNGSPGDILYAGEFDHGPLELAALSPPCETVRTHGSLRNTKSKQLSARADIPSSQKEKPQPRRDGFWEQVKRIDTLRPISKRPGTEGKTTGYKIRSSWQINVAAEEGSAASLSIPRRPFKKQGSQGYFEDLLRVISECDAGHPLCQSGVDGCPRDDPPELPTRVIDVGDAGRRPRLVVCHGRRGRYATLSHCWGGQSWVGATTESLPRLLDGFDIDAIPKTYADAIKAARSLRIQFLWIDSFCIVQDDRDDWAAESQRMGDIYEHAYLNIAAAGAHDSAAGFLETRKEPIYVRVRAAADEQAGYFYLTNQANSDFDASVARAKLNTRGWVLQERILSRRTIHFAADMWYWECGRHIRSEDGWQHGSRGGGRSSAPSLGQILDAPVSAIGKIFHNNDGYEPTKTDTSGRREVESEVLWVQILRGYSKCDLTFPEDKLPALQGLVNRFRRTAQKPYVFGHWIETGRPLPLSLMWFADRDGGLDFPTGKPLAPSWSCLKGNGSIGFHDTRAATPRTEIIRVEEGDWPSIYLRGRVRTATLAHPNGEGQVAKPTFYALSFESQMEYGTFTRFVGPAWFDDAAEVPGEVTLLLAYYETKRPKFSSRDTDQPALVLREVGDNDSEFQSAGAVEKGKRDGIKTYKRIGIANIKNHSFFDGAPVSHLVII
ncbi:hypothetical protein VTH06DRAFT_4079 [Thermothelomyces fergusii]